MFDLGKNGNYITVVWLASLFSDVDFNLCDNNQYLSK